MREQVKVSKDCGCVKKANIDSWNVTGSKLGSNDVDPVEVNNYATSPHYINALHMSHFVSVCLGVKGHST